jgi:zinc protease
MSKTTRILWLGCALIAACASTPPPAVQQPATAAAAPAPAQPRAAPKQEPPAAGPRSDIRFPALSRSQTGTGLELDTVEQHQLPVVHIKLLIQSGSAADPDKLPGLAHLTAAMLKEGTQKRSSQKLAEAIDFLGARLDIGNDTDRLSIDMQALSEHFADALALVAEIAQKPAFSQGELDKLKKRELARLDLQSQSPRFLASRELNKALYGDHPYAHVDTTAEVVKRLSRQDLVRWHAQHFAPNNAVLVVVGDVSPEQVKGAAEHAFAGWPKHAVPAIEQKKMPERSAREVILVDRPKSVQSVIFNGNLALARRDPDFIPLMVANQVLGGSAASRLFMDLREKRSLTYGAYSDVDERVQVAPFTAFASVRNEVTAEALAAFNEHLQRIVREAPAQGELQNAKHYLIDRFPLRIETADKIAELVADLRSYGLPDDYWDRFGSEIEHVTPEQALAAAQKYIRPNQSAIVVVGEATAVKAALDPYGPVTVVDIAGKLVVKPPAAVQAPSSAPAENTKPSDAAPAAATKKEH